VRERILAEIYEKLGLKAPEKTLDEETLEETSAEL
jgi:hypothetical protein